MKCDDKWGGGTKDRGHSAQPIMSVNDVVLHTASPLANLNRGFNILQLGTVPLKVQDIDMVFQEPELLDLLHNKCTLRRPFVMRIHRRNKKNGERHPTISAKVPFQPWPSDLEICFLRGSCPSTRTSAFERTLSYGRLRSAGQPFR